MDGDTRRNEEGYVRHLAMTLGIGLLVGGAILGQPTFESDGGPWGFQNPGVIDTDGTPGPSPGDDLFYPLWTDQNQGQAEFQFYCDGGSFDPAYPFTIGQTNSPPGVNILDEFQMQDFTAVFDTFDGNTAVGGSGEQPAGVMTEQSFEDLNGNGLYERVSLSLTGLNGGAGLLAPTLSEAGPVGVRSSQIVEPEEIGFRVEFVDVTGDGEPDFVGLVELNALGRTAPSELQCFGPFWLPLYRMGDTFHIALDLDGNGSPDPEFFVSAPLEGVASIPTLGQIGLLGLVLATGVIALRTLRVGG